MLVDPDRQNECRSEYRTDCGNKMQDPDPNRHGAPDPPRPVFRALIPFDSGWKRCEPSARSLQTSPLPRSPSSSNDLSQLKHKTNKMNMNRYLGTA